MTVVRGLNFSLLVQLNTIRLYDLVKHYIFPRKRDSLKIVQLIASRLLILGERGQEGSVMQPG